jgi:hypothetical protein
VHRPEEGEGFFNGAEGGFLMRFRLWHGGDCSGTLFAYLQI